MAFGEWQTEGKGAAGKKISRESWMIGVVRHHRFVERDGKSRVGQRQIKGYQVRAPVWPVSTCLQPFGLCPALCYTSRYSMGCSRF